MSKGIDRRLFGWSLFPVQRRLQDLQPTQGR